MSPDIIVYGIVAAGLVFWLRSLLGTRHGEERQRPNPFATPPENTAEQKLEGMERNSAQLLTPEDNIRQLADNKGRKFSIENKTAENSLLEILRTDKNFDPASFLQGAQDAFVMIVESFAEGDRETLRDLLAPNVYEAFESEIKRRETSGEKQMTDIHAMRRAEIIEAQLQGRQASITVRFTADETSVTRDREDRIVSGDPDRITEMRDVWTFSRDIKSRDPRWMVTETRSGFDGDNDLIPNV